MEDMARESEPCYPYGLCITLEKEVLEKLGLEVSEFKVGDLLPMDMIGKVTGITQDEHGYDCLTLQITDLGVETDEDEDAMPIAETVGGRLYGEE